MLIVELVFVAMDFLSSCASVKLRVIPTNLSAILAGLSTLVWLFIAFNLLTMSTCRVSWRVLQIVSSIYLWIPV